MRALETPRTRRCLTHGLQIRRIAEQNRQHEKLNPRRESELKGDNTGRDFGSSTAVDQKYEPVSASVVSFVR